MARLEYNSNATCNECGKKGAYAIYGYSLCGDCMDPDYPFLEDILEREEDDLEKDEGICFDKGIELEED